MVEFTICDVGNMIVFSRAEDMGIKGNENPADLDKNTSLIAKVRELRGKAAQKVGMCEDWKLVDKQSPMIPMVALVSSATKAECHVQSRLFLDNKCHTSMAGTGAICTAACSRIDGSVINKLLSKENLQKDTLEIQHPLGQIPVVAKAQSTYGQKVPHFETLSFVRTARRILDASLYVPADVEDCFDVAGNETVQLNGNLPNHDARNPAQPDGITRPTVDGEASKDSQAFTTKNFADFVAHLQYKDLTSVVKEKLQLLLLDYIGVSAAATQLAESSKPFLNAVRALDGGGSATVIANGQTWSALFAALLNGALAHTLDFDDTHATGALHPGVSVISAALSEAETNVNASPADLFTALAAGYEVTCRLGAALGTGGYSLGFHNTSTAGIFGAVAAIARLRHADSTTIENAFGVALSKVAGSMQYLANGSWNKRLHPGFAAHDAFTCVTLAQVGVLGATEAIEGKHGLLNVYSSLKREDSARLSLPFVKHWEFLSTAIKPYPACRMTHGEIELASKMSQTVPTAVRSITISLAKECYPIVGEEKENKVRPSNIVDAQFSAFYQTAVSWLYGHELGWKVYDYMNDSEVCNLLKNIKVDVNDAYVGLECSLKAEWEDGSVREEHLRNPTGEPDNPITWDGACTKFLGLTAGIYGKEHAKTICEAVAELETRGVRSLLDLAK